MAMEYPTAAFWLLLIGGILELIGVVPYTIIMGIASAGTMAFLPVAGVLLLGCAVWFLIWSILMILAAIWVKSGDNDKVHKGAVVGLIASILGGLNIIALIGAILAFTWKPPTVVAPPPPPPMM